MIAEEKERLRTPHSFYQYQYDFEEQIPEELTLWMSRSLST